jgi:hypothetical protein
MKEIKLWKVSPNENGKLAVQPINIVDQTKTESQLEEILVQSSDLLMKDLKLVGRQTSTPGGPLDLLGVDSEGRLVVFELKRGTLTREAVAQIIDYCSFLSELGPEELSNHISERSGQLGIEKIDNFQSWYQEQFGKTLSMLQKPSMVLVGLGVDERTRRMVSFLADSEIDISLITFHGFEEAGETFLARHIEVQTIALPGPQTYSKKSNLEKLQERVNNLGIGDFYYKISAFFRDKLITAYEWPNPGGYSYYLLELTDTGAGTNRVYVSLYIYDNQPGRVDIRFHPRAIEAASDNFEPIKNKFGGKIEMRPDKGAEVWINSLQAWEELTPCFEELCHIIVSGWKSKREKRVVEELKGTEQESSGEDN